MTSSHETLHEKYNPVKLRNIRVPGRSLRSWLRHLEQSDGLSIAKPNVKLKFQLAAIAKQLDGEKAVIFPQPGGSEIPVVSGIVSSRSRMAEAIGTNEQDILQKFQQAVASPIPCKPVTNAPCQQVVHREPKISELLPIPTHNELDGGPYISAGLIIVKNPEAGIQNVAIARLQVSGPSRLGAFLLPRHTMAFMNIAERSGDDLPCAIVIGASPVEVLASQAIVPVNQDELEIAGALIGEPLDVAKCLSSDIFVPASAEIIFEGRLLANERAPEGPFGEFTQYYGSSTASHVIEVDLITHRKDPMYHTIVGGSLEHLTFARIPREADILASIQRNFPGVRDLALSRGGVCRYHLNLQIDAKSEGEAKNAILAAFAAHPEIKKVVAVGLDVNIHDPHEVEWAIATRFQASRDLIVINDAQCSRLDPSADAGVGSKMGLDATVPIGSLDLKFKRISIPGEGAIVLHQVLDAAARLERTWAGATDEPD